MDMFEKVERLREKADVTYEEARAALEQAGGDLLDAIVLLEQQGKVKGPEKSTYSTEYDEQTRYVKVREKVEEQEKSAQSLGSILAKLFRLIIHFLRYTVFIGRHKEDTLFEIPTVVFALLLLFFWEALLPIMIIALFFGVRYSFAGSNITGKANTILNDAGDFADGIREDVMNRDDGRQEYKEQ